MAQDPFADVRDAPAAATGGTSAATAPPPGAPVGDPFASVRDQPAATAPKGRLLTQSNTKPAPYDRVFGTGQGVHMPSPEMIGGVIGGTALPEVLGAEGLYEVAAGALGAGGGGAAGVTAAGHPEDAVGAAERQAAWDVGGRAVTGALGWPLRKWLGNRVTEETGGALKERLQSAQDYYDAAKKDAADYWAKTKTSASAAVDAAAAKAHQAGEFFHGVKTRVAQEVAGAEASLRGTKLNNAATPPPSTADIEQAQATQKAARAAFQGPPPTVGVTQNPTPTQAGRVVNAAVQGPGRASLNKLGQAVEEAAATGPDVDFRPVKDKVQQMVGASQPSTMASEPSPGMAYVQAAGRSGVSTDALQKALTDAGVVMEASHPMPGVLKTIADAPDTVSFADAHKYKRMLDDAVSWDKQAKTQLGQMTKGARQEIRTQMSGHEPYDNATQAYAAAAPLFANRSIAGQLQKNALDNPGIVVRDVKSTEPVKLQMLFDILDNHAAQGGGAAAGQHAKEALQSAWTYKNLIQPGIDKFAANVAKMDPEFKQIMFGDDAGSRVFQNLSDIHDAYQKAVADEAAATQAHTNAVAGQKATQAQQLSDAQQQLAETRARGATDIRTAKGPADATAANLQTTKTQATRATDLAKSQGQQTVQAAKTQFGQAKAESATFAQSKLGSGGPPKDIIDQGLDTAWLVAHPHGLGAKTALKSLAKAPGWNDLVEWSSRSSARTKMLIDAFNSPYPNVAVQSLIRMVGSGLDKPLASHAPTSGPPPGPQPTPPPGPQ